MLHHFTLGMALFILQATYSDLHRKNALIITTLIIVGIKVYYWTAIHFYNRLSLGLCISQDRLGYGAVTKSPQIVVA